MTDDATWTTLVGGAALAFAIAAYYWLVIATVGEYTAQRLLGFVLNRSGGARTHSVDEVDSTLRLGIAVVFQASFCACLVAATRTDIVDAVFGDLSPILIVYGVILGVSEAALGSYLGHVCMRIAMKVAPARVPATTREWLAIAKGGWMRLYMNTARVAPIAVVIALTFFYVSVEEIVFRAVVIEYFDAWGAVVAIAVSTFMFMLVQVFHMPSWHAAMFPVVAASAIGVVHGALYFAVPTLAPLVVAHFVLFVVAVM